MNLLHPHTGAVLFSKAELACKSTGIVKLADGFADRLVMLRLAYGKPMVVTSCCRSAAHNKAVGGHSRSLHVYDQNGHGLNGTAAIDIRATGHDAWVLAHAAMRDGWSVGVAKTFIHLDRRDLAGLPVSIFGY